MIKRFFLALGMFGAILSIFALSPVRANAVDLLNTCSNSESTTPAEKTACADCNNAASNTDYCRDVKAQGSVNNPIISLIKTVITVVSYIGGVAAVIVLIISGLRLLLANGDSNTVSTARNGILYSLAGVAVIALAQVIVIFVLDRLQ